MYNCQEVSLSAMSFLKMFICVFILKQISCEDVVGVQRECTAGKTQNNMILLQSVIPALEGTRKGDAGKIGVIGGSIEYTGAPYFSAIAALKMGADLVSVITTESAAPVIKSYSPELIVYPYLNAGLSQKVQNIIQRMDVLLIGPGLGRDDAVLKEVSIIISYCQSIKKPLIIDADGIYLVSTNVSLIRDYPAPGVIVTPNYKEQEKLLKAMAAAGISGFDNWGEHVSFLLKGENDTFVSNDPEYNWTFRLDGSGRRAGGQGDILAGATATLYNWALHKAHENNNTYKLAASVASFGAARITRRCNAKAFEELGRSMTASDMLPKIHIAFKELIAGAKYF